MAFVSDFNMNRCINSLITLGLGLSFFVSLNIYYEKNKDNKKTDRVVNILITTYMISLIIGLIQFIAIKFNIDVIINFFDIVFKRSGYLHIGKVQYTFTEPSFISIHAFGVLLPLYLYLKDKRLLYIICGFIITSFIYNSGLRIVIDTIVVLLIFATYFLLKNRKYRKYLFIIVTIIIVLFTIIINSNQRLKKIVGKGVYADASLAARYFRIQSSIYGYYRSPINFMIGYGLGNSIIPITEGFDIAYSKYNNGYRDEVLGLQKYQNFSEDNATFCMYTRIISEFGFVIFAILGIYIYKLIRSSNLEYKIPLLLTIVYLYIQFDSYAFYAMWLLIIILQKTKKEDQNLE